MSFFDRIASLLESLLSLEQGFKERLISLTGILISLLGLVLVIALALFGIKLLLRLIKKLRVRSLIHSKASIQIRKDPSCEIYLLVMGDKIKPVCLIKKDHYSTRESELISRNFDSLVKETYRLAEGIKPETPGCLLSEVKVEEPIYLSERSPDRVIRELKSEIRKTRDDVSRAQSREIGAVVQDFF